MAIEIDKLRYRYPDGTLALKDISINIQGRKKIAILGANGSGKSTLLQHFNGLLIAESGDIRIKGMEVEKDNFEKIRKTVGFVFDNPDDQLFATTVFEDIAFGPRNLLLPEEKVTEVVNRVIDIIGIDKLRDRQPHNLSLGQKRKVAIAGVLSMEPDIMVFDEPFSGLDPLSLGQFIDILNKLCDIGHSLIVTTHDVDIAYSWAEEIVIIKDGKVLIQGDVSLLEREEILEEANLKLPTLYEIFSKTEYRPRTKVEAARLIEKLYRRNKDE